VGGIALKSLATEATYRRSAGQGSMWAGWNAFLVDHKTSSATTLGHQHIYRYLYNAYT
jgi:hypothetical protein